MSMRNITYLYQLGIYRIRKLAHSVVKILEAVCYLEVMVILSIFINWVCIGLGFRDLTRSLIKIGEAMSHFAHDRWRTDKTWSSHRNKEDKDPLLSRRKEQERKKRQGSLKYRLSFDILW